MHSKTGNGFLDEGCYKGPDCPRTTTTTTTTTTTKSLCYTPPEYDLLNTPRWLKPWPTVRGCLSPVPDVAKLCIIDSWKLAKSNTQADTYGWSAIISVPEEQYDKNGFSG